MDRDTTKRRKPKAGDCCTPQPLNTFVNPNAGVASINWLGWRYAESDPRHDGKIYLTDTIRSTEVGSGNDVTTVGTLNVDTRKVTWTVSGTTDPIPPYESDWGPFTWNEIAQSNNELSTEYTREMFEDKLAEASYPAINEPPPDEEWVALRNLPAGLYRPFYGLEAVAGRAIAINHNDASKWNGDYFLSASGIPWKDGDGSIVLRWFEIFITADGRGIDYGGEKTETVEPTNAQVFEGADEDGGNVYTADIKSSRYHIEAPDELGIVCVGLLPTLPTINIGVYKEKLSKKGFREFILPDDRAPRWYKRQTASGGFPGCPSSDPVLPTKTYSGFYRVYNSPSGFPSWSPTNTTERTLSTDANLSIFASPRPIEPGIFGGEQQPQFKIQPDVLSPTLAEWSRDSKCEEITITDHEILELTEEYTTSELIAAVSRQIDADWQNGSGGAGIGQGVAERRLSKDELNFIAARGRYRVVIGNAMAHHETIP
jgi:hypothetical protein